MSNRFDIAYGTRYNNTPMYQGMPLEALTNLAKDYSDKYNEGIGALGKAKDLLNVNAIDAHQSYKKQLLNDYNKRIDDLATRYVKDPLNYKNRMDLNNLIRDWKQDATRQELENSYNNYQDYQKDKIKKGDKYGEWYDNYIRFNGSKDGQLNPYRYTGMGEVQDHQKLALDMMKDVKADGVDIDYERLGDDGIIRGYKNGKEVISSDKIRGLAEGKVGSFLTTKEGQDFAKMVSYYQPNADINKLTEEYLYQAGANQIFGKTKQGNSVDVSRAWKTLHDENQANLTTSLQSEGINNQNQVSTIDDILFDSKGNIKAPNKVISKDVNSRDEFGKIIPGSKESVYKETNEPDFDKLNEQSKRVVEIQNNHPELRGLTPKQTIEAYNKAAKSLNNESIPLESISNLAAKDIGKSLSRNLSGRKLYLMDDKGVTHTGTKEEILNELGIKEYNNDKDELGLVNQLEHRGISGYTQAGPIPGAYYVNITDKEGNNRRLMIEPDAQMQTMFKASSEINDMRKSMKYSEKEIFPGYKIAVNPNISKDGNITWEYYEQIGNNKPVRTSLDEIRKQEKQALKESKYLGSQVQSTKDESKEVD